jgi:hypothetical protein
MSDIQDACLAKKWFYSFVLPNGNTVPSAHQHKLDLIHSTRTRMMIDFIQRHFGLPVEKKLMQST